MREPICTTSNYHDPQANPLNPNEESVEQRRLAKTSTLWSVLVNLILSITQIAMGLLVGANALIADGVHSLADLVSDAIALVVSAHSHKDADKEHPYGHRRFENAGCMALGGLVLAAGVGMMIGALFKIQALPPALHWNTLSIVALSVAVGAIIAKEILFRYMLKIAQKAKSSLLIANAWHARMDAASSVVAAVGLLGSLSGFAILDPIAALVVGLMVSKTGWEFFWPSLQDLMDHAVDDEKARAIEATLLQTPGVLGLHALRTRKMGDYAQVDVHLEVHSELTVKQGHDIAVIARERVMKEHQVLDLMAHIDPVDFCPLHLEQEMKN